jgi:signal-transduction protein with cAMP-binding, CBS, and nucleotidyltransferase domain
MALRPENELQAKLLLEGILLFSGAPSEQILALLAQLELVEFKKGKVILMEQELSKTLFILAKGSVGIYRRQGGEKKLVATLKSPDFFGETSMFTESPATAQVKAEEDTRLYALKHASFEAVRAKFPALGPLVQKHIEEIKMARPPLVKPVSTEES